MEFNSRMLVLFLMSHMIPRFRVFKPEAEYLYWSCLPTILAWLPLGQELPAAAAANQCCCLHFSRHIQFFLFCIHNQAHEDTLPITLFWHGYSCWKAGRLWHPAVNLQSAGKEVSLASTRAETASIFMPSSLSYSDRIHSRPFPGHLWVSILDLSSSKGCRIHWKSSFEHVKIDWNAWIKGCLFKWLLPLTNLAWFSWRTQPSPCCLLFSALLLPSFKSGFD